jgi:anti-sigma factor RsiW
MDQHIDPVLLNQYHDGRLGPAESGIVSGHVAGCAECGHRLSELRRSDDLVRLAGRSPAGETAADWSAFRAGVLAATVERPVAAITRRAPRAAAWVAGIGGLAAAIVLSVVLRPEPAISHLDVPEPIAAAASPGAGVTASAVTVPALRPGIGRSAPAEPTVSSVSDPTSGAPAFSARAGAPTPASAGADELIADRALAAASFPRTSPSARPVDPTPAVPGMDGPPAIEAGPLPTPERDPVAENHQRALARQIAAAFDSAELYLRQISGMNPADAGQFAETVGRLRADRVLEKLTHLRRRGDLDSTTHAQVSTLEAVFTKFTLAAGDFRSRDVEATRRDILRRFEFRRATIEEARLRLAGLRLDRPTAVAGL